MTTHYDMRAKIFQTAIAQTHICSTDSAKQQKELTSQRLNSYLRNINFLATQKFNSKWFEV